MTREELARFGALQQKLRDFPKTGLRLTAEEATEYRAFSRQLAASPEVADDPATLFTDESRRPQLNGTDYNDTLKAMCWSEVAALAKKYGPMLVQAAAAALKG